MRSPRPTAPTPTTPAHPPRRSLSRPRFRDRSSLLPRSDPRPRPSPRPRLTRARSVPRTTSCSTRSSDSARRTSTIPTPTAPAAVRRPRRPVGVRRPRRPVGDARSRPGPGLPGLRPRPRPRPRRRRRRTGTRASMGPLGIAHADAAFATSFAPRSPRLPRRRAFATIFHLARSRRGAGSRGSGQRRG